MQIKDINDVKIETMLDIFLNGKNPEYRLKAGEILLETLFGKHIESKLDSVDLVKIYRDIDEKLYKETEPLMNIISEEIKAREPLYFKYSGNLAEDTNNMFTYAMKTKDIYNKAYVMKSVVDRVLEQYFNALKKVKEDNVL